MTSLFSNNDMTVCVILSVLFVFIQPTTAQDWNYDDASPVGPSHWKDRNPTCGGARQSPINIRTTRAIHDPTLTCLQYRNYDKIPSTYTIVNNGHSVQVTVPAGQHMSITKGGLTGEYILEQFHFHWGKDNSEGSEHLVNGRSHPLEIHLVHYSSKYTSVATAAADATNPSAIAVVGIFVDVGTRKLSSTLGTLTTAFSQVIHADNKTVEVRGFAMSSLIPKKSSYYRYSGSLTTPGCAEVVVWTVYSEPLYITKAQMKSFRQCHSDGNKVHQHNFRPTQPLFNRRVVVYN